MSESVRQRLLDSLENTTAAGRAIANYMLANLGDLPFENTAAIAKKVGVSELTVGRFCRSIGYKHLKELKRDLKVDLGDSPWRLGDRLRDFQARSRQGDQELVRSLELQIAALVRVYELAQTPEWTRVVQRLATVPRVFVAGFQTERGIATLLAHKLQYLRDGVQLVDLSAGHFAEVLLSDPAQCALVIFEARRYSRHAELLAKEARSQGIPVTLITDLFCDWANACADEVFCLPTEVNLFWEVTGPSVTLVHLLLNSVFNEIGPAIEQRLNRIADLYGRFVGHTGHNTRGSFVPSEPAGAPGEHGESRRGATVLSPEPPSSGRPRPRSG